MKWNCGYTEVLDVACLSGLLVCVDISCSGILDSACMLCPAWGP